MITSTLSYYDRAAEDLVERYEGAEVAGLQRDMLAAVAGRSPVLELGCGSGRDAAVLARAGLAVVPTDGSAALAACCAERHPEFRGTVLRLPLPAPLPFRDATFGAVTAVAVLMHLSAPDMSAVLGEIHRVLRDDGVLFLSVPSVRDDVGADSHDEQGRLFVGHTEAAWRDLLEGAGFRVTFRAEAADGLGRSGLRWFSFAAAIAR